MYFMTGLHACQYVMELSMLFVRLNLAKEKIGEINSKQQTVGVVFWLTKCLFNWEMVWHPKA